MSTPDPLTDEPEFTDQQVVDLRRAAVASSVSITTDRVIALCDEVLRLRALAREVEERRRRDKTDHAVIDGHVYEVAYPPMQHALQTDLLVLYVRPAAAGPSPEGGADGGVSTGDPAPNEEGAS